MTVLADLRVQARPTPDAVTVPRDYAGLSVEWSMVEPWFGRDAGSAVAATATLLQTLQRDPTTAGVLRVGGNSQDGYLWEPDGDTTGNTLFTGVITRGMVDALLEVARRASWHLVLGVNLRADDPARAAAMAQYVSEADTTGQVLALELGNEPNAYFGTDVDAYLARYTAYAQAIALVTTLSLTGPAISHLADLSYLQRLREAAPGPLAFTTWHHYANQPTRGALLAELTTAQFRQRVAQADAAAGGRGRHRMGEGNSVGNGGLDGISNVLTSANWLLDALLAGAASGLAGFQVHSWDGRPYPQEGRTCYYTPFVVRDGVASARPPYYGLALFRYALARTFVPYALSVTTGERVHAYALRDEPSGRLYVYVLEKSGTGHSGTVRITVPAGYGDAYLSRLGDAGGCAGKTTGIDGAHLDPAGTFAWEAQRPRPAPGTTRYDVPLGPCQAVLLSVGPR